MKIDQLAYKCLAGMTGIALAAALALPSAASAGERGKFKGKSVLYSTQYQEIKSPDGDAAKTVQIGELDGIVFNEMDGGFLDKARYQVVWKGYGNGSSDCQKIFTTGKGKVFGYCVGQSDDKGNDEGTITLTGGTDAYQGIKGKGKYKLKMVSDRLMWDLIEWDYEIP